MTDRRSPMHAENIRTPIVPRRCEAINELRAALLPYSKGHLFRGQTCHYELPSAGPSLTSSFARLGCIPPLTRKWSFWAMLFLEGITRERANITFSQALLQHYGWRSFFLDLTENPGVAAWFAGFGFHKKGAIHINLEQDFAIVRDAASYLPNLSDGHLYVLSIEKLESSGYYLADLTQVRLGARCRPQVQSAWLAGILNRSHTTIHSDCVVAHFTGPAEIFRRFAAEIGFDAIGTVFPPSSEDFVLEQLEAQPWERIKSKPPRGIPHAYRRMLAFPDYHSTSEILLPPDVALYSQTWVSNRRLGEFRDALFFKAADNMFFGSGQIQGTPCSEVWPFLDEYGLLVVESSSIMRTVKPRAETSYYKGVIVSRVDDTTIEVNEMLVNYRATTLTGVAVAMGYSYERAPDKLRRTRPKTDCSCGNELWHGSHVSILEILNESIRRGKIRSSGDRAFRILPW